jgi:hypothetical protein
MSTGREIPAVTSVLTDEAVDFAIAVIDSSGVPQYLESLLVRRTGRRRSIPLRALLVALYLLASDGRALHLKSATRLLFARLPPHWREVLSVTGEAATTKALLARYRQVRYLFHLALSVIDPSVEVRNRILDEQTAARMRKKLSQAEVAERKRRLEWVITRLVQSSVEVLNEEELAGFDGSVGLDATPVPLYSRGPSPRAGTTASDPDGGWYVREGDHRDVPGPAGKKLRKLFWATEATLVSMGRPPGAIPGFPNLILALALGRPGADPAGTAVRLLVSVVERGYKAGFLGADRGYTQCVPGRFHLPVRALGYSLVMDYKNNELGMQANSQGALLVDGCFYCPAMPDDLVQASAHHRAGLIDQQTYNERIEARRCFRLVRKEGPDKDGYERLTCPALGDHAKVCCVLRPAGGRLGAIPVLCPPQPPPRICTQTAVTIAPDVGARHRQDLAFGSDEWAHTYAAYRNTIEGQNGYLKDNAHEALGSPDRRRVRGIAAQSLFCGLLVMAANVRRIAAFRQLVADGAGPAVAERARRRRTSIRDYRPPPVAA